MNDHVAEPFRSILNAAARRREMSYEDALDAVWPHWRNPLHPVFVGSISRSVEEAIAEMEREANAERVSGGWTVRLNTFRRLAARPDPEGETRPATPLHEGEDTL